MKWWIALAIGAAVGLVALKSRGRANVGRWTDEDVEYLARLAMLEASTGDDDEQAAIMQVAINRAIVDSTGIREVVATTRWSGGGARGQSFVAAIQSPAGTVTEYHRSPLDYPQFRDALHLAGEVAIGRRPNRIGGRRHFVHPRGLARCTDVGPTGDGRYCYPWSEGLRVTPLWAISSREGGAAEFEPIRIGRAIFT